jgi:hypothetical protein
MLDLNYNNSSTVASYLQGDQLDLALDFDLASAFLSAAKAGRAVDGGDLATYSLLRTSQDERILIIINLGEKPVSGYNLSLSLGALPGGYRAVSLYCEETFPDLIANAQGGFDAYQPVSTLPGGSPLLVQLQPLN